MLGLLHRSELSWLHPALIQGYVTTAGSGSETVLQASRRALVDFGERGSESGAVSLPTLLGQVSTVLERSPHEDRTAIPALEVLAFMLEVGALPDNQFEDEHVSRQAFSKLERKSSHLLHVVGGSHTRSRKSLKLEAAVRVYSAMAWQESTRKDALDRLARMLLHPFARVSHQVDRSKRRWAEYVLDQMARRRSFTYASRHGDGTSRHCNSSVS